ncbi:hypothetical protein ELAC_0555 [Estrella lausannensis]|uniref:Uncharacterized protein n=1 Tax=Estrella lausannensis TaxID=483423 RepID=A0A0H5E3W8_9BACT|nr:hypothetical protein ELAC_0555 [Estrella lausannensis]
MGANPLININEGNSPALFYMKRISRGDLKPLFSGLPTNETLHEVNFRPASAFRLRSFNSIQISFLVEHGLSQR